MPLLTDWTIQLQYDDTKVVKGLEKTGKKIDQLSRKITKNTNKIERSTAKLNAAAGRVGGSGGSSRAAGGTGSARSTGGGVRPISQTPASVGIRPISQTERLSKGNQINTANRDIAGLQSSLAGNSTEAAIRLNKRLQRETTVLSSLQKQLAKTTDKNSTEYRKLVGRLDAVKNRIKNAKLETRSLNKEFKATTFAASGAASSLKNLARQWVSIFAVMAGGKRVFDTTKEFQNMRATLLLTSGSAVQAGKDLEFLAEMSERIGLVMLDTGKSFAKFGVAGKSAGLTDGEMKTSFEEMAVAIRSTGLNQERANLSFLALQQMLSNGVVSMQELKLQLSEQLPQTMATAEKALRNLGHTSGSVKEIISSGAVESGSFVKELTRLMKDQAIESGAYAASINTLEAEQNRFTNKVNDSIDALGEQGKVIAIGEKVFRALGVAVVALSPFVSALTQAVNLLLVPLDILVKVFNQLGSLFGSENAGIIGATNLLSWVIATKLVRSLQTLIGTQAVVWLKTAAAATWGWVTGAKALDLSLKSVLLSLRAIGRMFLIGFGLEALSFGVDYLTNQGRFQGGGSGSGGSTNNNKVTNIDSINFNVDGGDPQAIADTLTQTLANS